MGHPSVDDNESVFCAKGKMTDSDPTCAGDSGGPLVCQRVFDARWELTGVTSYGYGKEVEERMLWNDAAYDLSNNAAANPETAFENITDDKELDAVAEGLKSKLEDLLGINNQYSFMDDLFMNYFDQLADYDYYAYDGYAYLGGTDYNSAFSDEEKKSAAESILPPGQKVMKNSASNQAKVRSFPCGGQTPGMFTRTASFRNFINNKNEGNLFMQSFEPTVVIELPNGGIPSIEFSIQILNEKNPDTYTNNSLTIARNNVDLIIENQSTDLADAQKELNIYTLLQNHGCYCKNLFNLQNRWPSGGKPADPLDKICQKWWMCRRCNEINQICTTPKISVEYSARVQNSTGNILECLDDVNNQTCAYNQCSCDKKFLQTIKELILLEYNGKSPEKSDCPVNQKRDPQYLKCCGASPNWVTFSENRYSCEDGKLKWKDPKF